MLPRWAQTTPTERSSALNDDRRSDVKKDRGRCYHHLRQIRRELDPRRDNHVLNAARHESVIPGSCLFGGNGKGRSRRCQRSLKGNSLARPLYCAGRLASSSPRMVGLILAASTFVIVPFAFLPPVQGRFGFVECFLGPINCRL